VLGGLSESRSHSVWSWLGRSSTQSACRGLGFRKARDQTHGVTHAETARRVPSTPVNADLAGREAVVGVAQQAQRGIPATRLVNGSANGWREIFGWDRGISLTRGRQAAGWVFGFANAVYNLVGVCTPMAAGVGS
jgi:hypothetical protein